MDLSHDYLTRHAGSQVSLLDDEGSAVLELTLAEPTAVVVSGGWQSWSLDLQGPTEPVLPQQSYRVRFADGGESWLFLVPVAADQSRTTYQSAFSREAT